MYAVPAVINQIRNKYQKWINEIKKRKKKSSIIMSMWGSQIVNDC